MSVLLMGHLLLGCLLLIALLANGLLLRLGQQWRHRAPGSLHTLLLWMPVGLLAVALLATALAEFNLLTYQHEPDTSGVSWFMLGACLMIFADVCSTVILIRLKELLHTMRRARDDLEIMLPLALDTSGRAAEEQQAEE